MFVGLLSEVRQAVIACACSPSYAPTDARQTVEKTRRSDHLEIARQ